MPLSRSAVAKLLFHLFFPVSCPICGAEGESLCPDCLQDLLAAEEASFSLCLSCESPAPCREHGGRYELRALTRHHRASRELLLAVKYGRLGAAARVMGQAMAALITEKDGLDWTLIPIPPHERASLFPEGPDPLEWMIRGLSERLGCPVEKDCLRWRRRRAPQKEQPDGTSRRAMPADAFICLKAPPRRVILTDDVCTTGTTLLRAAQCLYQAGAEQVLSLCWSRRPLTP